MDTGTTYFDVPGWNQFKYIATDLDEDKESKLLGVITLFLKQWKAESASATKRGGDDENIVLTIPVSLLIAVLVLLFVIVVWHLFCSTQTNFGEPMKVTQGNYLPLSTEMRYYMM